MRNADLVLAALARLAPDRVPAQSGGSMNNVMMGGSDERGEPWAFYETNGCGMGARPNADGLDGIQAHMTNTLNTPIEVLDAITTSDTVDHSVIRLVLSDPERAMGVFEDHGTLVVEDDVIMLEGDNKSGSLARIARKLADADINIEYCYCATSPNAKKGLMILRTSNAKKALKVLNS